MGGSAFAPRLLQQENRLTFREWEGTKNQADFREWRQVYEPPVPRPTPHLLDKMSRSCVHTPGKVARQRATVKAVMNVTAVLRPAEWVDTATNPSRHLAAHFLI